MTSKLERVRLPAVDRAMDLFELLSTSSVGVSLADASRKLAIPKSTTHYLLYTLLSRDYIRRSSDGRTFIMGPRVSLFANINESERQLSMLASEELKELTDRLKLAALLAGLRSAQIVLIGYQVPAGGDGGGAWVGHQNDVHCTSLGKALIAHLSEPELKSLLMNRPLARYTANTICSLERLRKHLATVREHGYAVNNEEHISGIKAVACPVFNDVGKVVAAVGLCGSTTELPSWRIPKMGKELISAATLLSRKAFGGVPFEG